MWPTRIGDYPLAMGYIFLGDVQTKSSLQEKIVPSEGLFFLVEFKLILVGDAYDSLFLLE